MTEQLDENCRQLIFALKHEPLTLRQLMVAMGLKHRLTFLANYLRPAIEGGIVRLLYPDNPRHPRQKYLLTVKGLAFLQKTARRQCEDMRQQQSLMVTK